MKYDPFTRLCELAAPPDAPRYNEGDWKTVENALGLQLPDDYKQFIKVYGCGVFHGRSSSLCIKSYLGPVPAKRSAENMADYFRMLEVPFDVYPAKPGLLYLGEHKDVDTLAWHTKGEPNEWSIVYVDVETGAHEIEGVGVVEFILSILVQANPLQPEIIRMGAMAGPHTFDPDW